MPQRHATGSRTRGTARRAQHKAPVRSASAARAHAAGEVSYVIDLARPAAIVVQESVDASRYYAMLALLLLTAALWIYDIATLVSGAAS